MMDGDRPPLDRRGAWLLLVTSALVWVGLAAWLVPWEWSPGRIDPVEAGDYFTASEVERAEEYAGALRPLADASLVLGLLVATGLAWSPWGRRLARKITARIPWWVGVPLAVLVFDVAVRAVRLPFARQIRQRRLQEGLTEQAEAGWWADQGLSLLVTWVVGSLAVLLLVGCARRWPRRWYLPLGAGALVATYALSMAYPVAVEPLFNRFTPLPDGDLRSELVEIADRQGVDVGEVLVADASRRTTTLNAYVSGLGETKRLVLYDTLLDDAPADEVVVVVAHEVAHAARDDVLVGTTLGAVGALVGVAALALLLDGTRGRRRGGLARASAAWPLLATVALAGVLVSPIENTVSRAIETRADVDSLDSTRHRSAFQQLQVRLAQRSLADPDPPVWRQLWWGSHPTVLERLALWEERSLSSASSLPR
jgi:STE24 endopeptidase